MTNAADQTNNNAPLYNFVCAPTDLVERAKRTGETFLTGQFAHKDEVRRFVVWPDHVQAFRDALANAPDGRVNLFGALERRFYQTNGAFKSGLRLSVRWAGAADAPVPDDVLSPVAA